MRWQVRLKTLEDTGRLGAALAQNILAQRAQLPLAIALCGPLGAGKTELVRCIAGELGVRREAVTSPTYVLMQRYRGVVTLNHLDFYRLKSVEEVWDLGIDEWLVEPAVTIIEWADKFCEVWPDEVLRCDLSLESNGSRLAQFTAQGARAQAVLEGVAACFTPDGIGQ